jgi:hypothetical protein
MKKTALFTVDKITAFRFGTELVHAVTAYETKIGKK